MKGRLRQEVPQLKPNSEAREISTASDALARAVMSARPKARQGDFFDKQSSQVITRRLREAIKANHLEAALAAIDDEPPRVVTPRVHLRFPDAAQMATMPPSLLRVLPPLPEGLEYGSSGSPWCCAMSAPRSSSTSSLRRFASNSYRISPHATRSPALPAGSVW